MNFEIQWQQSPNYRSGRNGKQVIAIVNHITAGSMPGTLSWLCNSKAQASSHYLVTKAGEIFQLVKDADTAWHAGIVNKPNWNLYDGTNPNYYTIGIEHENLEGEPLTEEQYQATLFLHRDLINKFGLIIDEDHILGHCKIDSVNRPNDPGDNFPWERLFADLREGEVSKMIDQWKIQMGIDASNKLTELGLMKNPEEYADKMGEKVDNWLFFEMLKRIALKL